MVGSVMFVSVDNVVAVMYMYCILLSTKTKQLPEKIIPRRALANQEDYLLKNHIKGTCS